MNPIILNPDPLAILKASNEINDPTRKPRVKDGFQIVDGNRTKGSAWSSDADYSNAVKKNFDYTADNFNEAKLRAVREGKPLVVVAGSNNGDTKQLVESTIPGAKNGKQSAIYVYADVNKLDPNSELGKKMAAARGDTSRPYTAIFAPKADASGNPQLEDHLANTWGARSEVATIVQQQLGSAQTVMDTRKGTFQVADSKTGPQPDATTDKTTDPAKATDALTEKRKLEDAAEERIAPNVKTILDSFKQLKGANFTQRESLYDAANKAAAGMDPKDLALVKEKTTRAMQELGKSEGPEFDALKSRQAVLDLMTNAPSWINMNHGMSLLHTSQLDKGVAAIREGAKSNPQAYNDPKFIENLLKTPYEVSKLKEKFPEVKFDDYLKHKKAGTIDQFVAANKPTEQVQPPKVEKVEVKPEKAIKQPEKLEYEGADFEKSLEDAFNSGRRLVVKVGSPDCKGCEEMKEKAWPDARVQQQLKDNAVFTNVNGETREDIVKKYEALSWPSVMVIEPYKDEQGKIQARVIEKIEPNTPEGRSADSLNAFLTKNLTPPKPVDVIPPVKAPEVKIPPVEVKPAVKPEVAPEPTKVQDKTNEVLTPDEQAAFLRLQTAQKNLLAPLRALQPNSDAAAMDKAFGEAIANAKAVKPEDIKLATGALERQKAKAIADGAKADDPKLLKVDADLKMVQKIDQTEAYLNISRGAVKLKFNPENMSGKADIRTGLDMRKELAQSSSVIGKLQSTGVPAEKLKEWFPEVPIAIGTDKPAAPAALDPVKVKEAADRLYEQHASNKQLTMIPQTATKAEVQAGYKAAIENSRKVNPADVQLVVASLDARKAEIEGRGNLSDADKQQLAVIEQDKVNYSRIGIADGILQVGLGLREISMDKEHPESGIENIRQGLNLRKELLNDPNIAERLRREGYSNEKIAQLFPGLTLGAPEKRVEPSPVRDRR